MRGVWRRYGYRAKTRRRKTDPPAIQRLRRSVRLAVPKQTWSTLRVSFDGARFEVFFDGTKIMEVEDKTFTEAGKVGFWTKADSVTYFDDFQIDKKN